MHCTQKFWSLYARSYAELTEPNVMTFALTLLNMLKIEDADTILEVACGSGKTLPIALSRKKPEALYYATDLSFEMLTYCKYRVQ